MRSAAVFFDPRVQDLSLTEKPTWNLLLIDPNRMSRATNKRQLEYYGYAVREAESGRQAVLTVQQQPRAIDLILLDTSIADAPSANVLQVLQKLRPEAPVILITDQTVTDGRSMPSGVVAALKKPMRTDRLLAVVGKALGRT